MADASPISDARSRASAARRTEETRRRPVGPNVPPPNKAKKEEPLMVCVFLFTMLGAVQELVHQNSTYYIHDKSTSLVKRDGILKSCEVMRWLNLSRMTLPCSKQAVVKLGVIGRQS